MNRTFRLAFAGLSVFLASCGDGPTNGGGGGGGGDGGGGGGNNPGPPSNVAGVSGSGQQVPAGQAAQSPLIVKVTDAQGRAVPNTAVAFAAAAGSGSVSAASATTGADGQAQVSWTVGASAGTHSVSATVGTLSTTFTATVTPNATLNATVTYSDALVASPARLPGAGPSRVRATRKANRFLGRTIEARATRRSGTRANVVPGALIVTLRPAAIGAPASPRTRLTRGQSGTVAQNMARVLEGNVRAGRRLRDVSPQLAAARMTVEPGMEEQAAAELRANPAVLRVERDAYAYATGGIQSNDPLLTTQAWHYQMIDLPRAWKRTTGNTGVLVAVVDDGIRFDHPDVAPNLTSDGYDFVSSVNESTDCGTMNRAGDGNGYDPDPTIPAAYDGCELSQAGGHGLHVAGTIGAVGNNGMGMSGVAWTVRIRPVRVLGTTGSGSSFDIAQGILYAAGLPASNGAGGVVQAPTAARIINLSLGSPGNSPVMHDAVKAATAAGSLLVVAAGNDNTSAPFYPAAYPEVLTVSAVGPTWARASYSNWGPNVDIAAPGGDQVNDDWWSGIASTQWDFAAGQPTYNLISGTSMATPHVAGAAALLLAQEPALTAAQLRARLLDFAVDQGAAGVDPIFGAGVLNVRNSLAQSKFIQGRLFGRVYDAATGAIVREVLGTGNTFSMGQLGDGAFHVFAGIDDEGDGLFGTNGFRWGGLTAGDGSLGAVTIQGAATYPAAFTIGFGAEREPANNSAATATRIMLGGSLYAQMNHDSDVDVYSVVLPAGNYVFETVGTQGTCGLATNADTELTLRSSAGTVLAQNDDVNPERFNYCSRIAQSVPAGTYTLSVTGYTLGGYRVIVRPAS
jgi:subtilisin family serine protease